jgi:hypothetical protein
MSNELERPLNAPTFVTTVATLPIRRQAAGGLVVPSGQIIACDPSAFQFEENQHPFDRSVPPGTFPVTVALLRSGRFEIPVYLMVEFSKEPAVGWALATRSGKTLRAAKSATHFVDSGCSCFMDADTALRLVATEWDKNIYRGRLLDAMHEGMPPKPWATIILDSKTGANLVACTSGYGDGSYTNFWGIDASGTLTCLVTDFEVTAP